MKFFVYDTFPEDLFETLPAAIYDIISQLNYFVFDYELVGTMVNHMEYTNPFSGEVVSANFPSFGSGGLISGIMVESIEKLFNISIHVTFFDILVGPILVISLTYAFIKFLLPTS